MQKFFLTTPIYYVNARPHIGHAYTTIVADVLARRARAQGIETYFLTGTDEHGQKIERSAQAAGIPPQQFADEVSATFSTLWQRMGITHDAFIRTTSARHKRGVQKLFQTLKDNGKIELRSYTGSYCVSDEAFVDLPAGAPCPDCGRPLETVTEQNYFFKLSEYQLPLINLIESGELSIQPESRRNEVLSFLRGPVSTATNLGAPRLASETWDGSAQPSLDGALAYSALGTPYVPGALKDLSISRTSFKWGIPVPGDEQHVIYVWLDALANYMTALGYGSEEDTLFQKFWPADLHIVGKEIIRFHCVYWPAFLLAAGLPLPKQVVAHGWLLFEESKMSKSRGNIVRTETILDAFGPLCPPPPAPTDVDRKGTPSGVPQTPPDEKVSGPSGPNTPAATHAIPTNLSAKAMIKGTTSVAPQTPPDERLLGPSGPNEASGNDEASNTDDASRHNEPLGRPRLQPWLSPGAAETGLQPLGHSAADLKHHQDLFAADVLRYFLLREIPFGQDGSFSFDALITRYNADLANGYGNLVSRTLNMIKQNFSGIVPDPDVLGTLKGVRRTDATTTLMNGVDELATFFNGAGASILGKIADDIDRKAFNEALLGVSTFIAKVDIYLAVAKPWLLAKGSDEVSQGSLQISLYSAAESIRIITLLLHPILPYAAAKVWAQLGLNPADLTSQDPTLRTENRELRTDWGGLQPGTKLGPLSPIFPRADKGLAQIMTDMENPAPPAEPIACVTGPNDPPTAKLSDTAGNLGAPGLASETWATTTPIASEQSASSIQSAVGPSFHPAAAPRTSTLAEPNPGAHVGASAAVTTERPGTPHHTEAQASGIFASQPVDSSPQITIDDFAKVELRVAQVLVCERIPKADKLLRLEVDLGYEKRQILSGIAEWYTPEELIGRRIVVITNLAPRKMRGLESHGMLLAASAPAAEGEPGGKPHLATFTDADSLPLGSRLK